MREARSRCYRGTKFPFIAFRPGEGNDVDDDGYDDACASCAFPTELTQLYGFVNPSPAPSTERGGKQVRRACLW